MLKEILFTHDDLDGVGCSVIYHLAHMHMREHEEYEVVNCSNFSINDDVRKWLSLISPNETEITFADICCDEYLLKELYNIGYDIKVFDHHKTNMYACDIVEGAQIIPINELGVMESGTSLIYNYYVDMGTFMEKDPHAKYIIGDKANKILLPKFVDTVRSYDTWEWKRTSNMNAKYLQTLFILLGLDKFTERYIKKLTDINDKYLVNKVDMEFIMTKIENEQKVIDEFTPDKLIDINVRGYKTGLIIGYTGANIGDLSHQFLLKYPEYDMICGFILGSESTFSFRTTRDDFDTGAIIAAPIGGGGHPKASGAPLDEEIKDEIISMLVNELNK